MNEQFAALLSEFDDTERFCGVVVVGSEARGDATSHSDIDLAFYAACARAARTGRCMASPLPMIDDFAGS